MLIIVLIMCRWYRAQVTQLLENDRATLFFVDHGDKASVSIHDIAPITEMQIKKLPFQVSVGL
jgi:hypothetical protein